MGGGRFLAGLAAALGLLWLAGPAAAQSGPFGNWAVIVVAGDFHAAGGAPTEAFDNARRDVSAALAARGFSAGNIRQFSVRPELYSNPAPGPADFNAIAAALAETAQRAPGGCLVYFTSHGAPTGILLGRGILPPMAMAEMISRACGSRPTIVVLSACFSGVFIPALQGSNRVILTAARPDRTSFGCGVANRYPFFDECFLQALPQVRDFAALGPAVQTCVAQRESAEGMAPPSEPQFWIDPGIRPMLPMYAFARPP